MISIKDKLLDDPFQEILGQEDAKEQLKSALLMRRNVIVVGPPGIGKTTLAKSVAQLIPEGNFVRVQGSPDLTSEDLLGDIDPVKALKFGPSSDQAFTPGKIFKANNGVLFFDELNRCPEKLQNALLQVLEERKATIGSHTVDIKADFIFIGTMNPEDSSTEKLSHVFLDRFDLIYMDYPEDQEKEEKIVLDHGIKEEVQFDQKLVSFLVSFVRTLRQSNKLAKKPSVRATLGLYERAQANAILRKRNSVEMMDIKDSIISVLAHRIEMKPSAKYSLTPEEFLKEEMNSYSESSTDGDIG